MAGSLGSASLTIQVLAVAAVSSENSNGEDLLQIHMVVGRIQCLAGWQLRVTVPHWLLAGIRCEFPGAGLHQWALTTWQLISSEEPQRECEQDGR